MYAPRESRKQHPSVDHELWWLKPTYVAGIMAIVVGFAAYWIPAAVYRSYWHTPKYFGQRDLAMILCFAFAFCLSVAIGSYARFHPNQPVRDWKGDLPYGVITKAFNSCTVFAIAGYVAWAGAAISRGASWDAAMGVLRGEKGAIALMKENYLMTIAGVTTLTQLGIAAGLLGVLVGLKLGWKSVWWKFAILLAATVVRALMNAERLAILELCIPALALFVRLGILDSPRWSGRLWPLLRVIPVIALILLLIIFGASEYLRSWSNYYAGGDQNFLEFVSARFLGYYVTALNNGALVASRLHPTGVPYFTLHVLWRFPVVSKIVKLMYPAIENDVSAFDPYMSVLGREGNEEFNNGCGWLTPVWDFGFTASVLYWVVCGLICGVLYRWFQQRRIAGLLLYPIIFVSVVELPRVLYWAEGRNLVPILALIPVILLSVRYGRQFRSQRYGGEAASWQLSR